MKVSVLNIKGKDTGRSIELSKSIFDVGFTKLADKPFNSFLFII